MSAFATHANDIVYDRETGRIENALVHERFAIVLMRSAIFMLGPVHLYGISYVARAIRTVLPSKKSIKLTLNRDAIMRIDYLDAYWSQLLSPSLVYEPAVTAFVKAFKDTKYRFIDGGANHGYWSILASTPALGAQNCIAVEAASDTFEHLEQNCTLNGNRFETLNRAIGAASGEQVEIFGTKHEARTIIGSNGAASSLKCETISLDDLGDGASSDPSKKVVVKLDVEGMEVAAMNAATCLLSGDTVFLYEDHGSDRTHASTRNAISKLGLRIFWLGEKQAIEIFDPKELRAIKKSRRFGYDMAATKSAFWLNELERIVRQDGTKVA